MNIKSILGAIGVSMLGLPIAAQAAVIESSNVTIDGSSYETFLDDTTNLIWLDIDSFWNTANTYNTITTLLSGSGFHIANFQEIDDLQLSMPAIPSTFTDDAVIVGGNYVGHLTHTDPRDIIWGLYNDDDQNTTINVGLAHRLGTATIWTTAPSTVNPNTQLADWNTTYKDLGAWVVSDAPVPIPAAVWLFGSGLIGLIGLARRKA